MTDRHGDMRRPQFDPLSGLLRENAPARIASLAEQLADAREKLLSRFTDQMEQHSLARLLLQHIDGKIGRAECEEVLKR